MAHVEKTTRCFHMKNGKDIVKLSSWCVQRREKKCPVSQQLKRHVILFCIKLRGYPVSRAISQERQRDLVCQSRLCLPLLEGVCENISDTVTYGAFRVLFILSSID